MIEDAVIAFVPALQAAAHVVARSAGLEAHEGVGEIVVLEIVLGREVVGLGLALLSDARGELIGLVEMVGNGAEVVEEFAEQVPAAVAAHDVGAEEAIAFEFDGVLEEDLPAVELDVAEAFIIGGERAVGGLGGGGEPALVDAAAMTAEDVEIARIELETSTRHKEGARHPAGGEADHTFAGGERFADDSRHGLGGFD